MGKNKVVCYIIWIQAVASNVTLGKLINLFALHFLYLFSGDNNSTYLALKVVKKGLIR